MNQRSFAWLGAVVLLSGCATLTPQAGFDEVSRDSGSRLEQKIHWYQGGAEDQAARQAVDALLAKELDVDGAIQLALLNNQQLQATYTELGISQANLVQAGLLRNPVFSGTWKYEHGDRGRPALDFELGFEFLNILFIPLRTKVAEAEFTLAKHRVTAMVLDHAAATRSAFYRYQADAWIVDIMAEAVAAASASLGAAERLRAAGNITEAMLDGYRLLAAEARLAHGRASAAAGASREQLNVLMGLDGRSANWTAAAQLAPLPATPLNLSAVEQQARDVSLDLEILRARIGVLAAVAGIKKVESVLPDLELGYAWEKSIDGEIESGPAISLPIPLFDFGQARRYAAAMEMERAQADYLAKAVEVQSAARAAVARLKATRGAVETMVDELIPLSARMQKAALLEYNAMQIGVFRLIGAYEKRLTIYQRFVEALRDYWLARADLQTLLSGRAVEITAGPAPSMASSMSGDAGGH